MLYISIIYIKNLTFCYIYNKLSIMNVIHHHPQYLPISLDYGKFARELAEAQYAVGLLQGSQSKLINARHLISPLIAREAAVSSKIEGTQSTSSDIYVYGAGGKPVHDDTPVVSNYRVAMNTAIEQMEKGQALSMHLIKATHGILLDNVRHKGVIGAFRSGDVWIAEKEGDPIEKALYIPPEHIHVPTYIENILEYIENHDDLNLVKAAVIHYQFEAVHPFEDGNGRIGRLLIPLILSYKGELSLPIVYISGYFEAKPEEYRQALRQADTTGEYEPWIKFFLQAVKDQAYETLRLVENIHKLNTDLKKRYESSKSPYLGRFIDYLFKNPVFTVPMAMEDINIPVRLTVTRLIELLEKDGIIQQIKGQRGAGGTNIYAYWPLLELIS